MTALVIGMWLASMVGAETGDDKGTAGTWTPLQFLVGEWTGTGEGRPGNGTGRFTFAFELQGKVLVRRGHAEFPPHNGRPGNVHDDLMVIYPEVGVGQIKAVYFDSENHVIHYRVQPSEDRQKLVFLSEPSKLLPEVRLTYTRRGDRRIGVKFEVRAPGPGESFRTYLEGDAERSAESKPISVGK